MRSKHVELRMRQQNYHVASSWHFILFHEEDTRSDNPQISEELPWRHRQYTPPILLYPLTVQYKTAPNFMQYVLLR